MKRNSRTLRTLLLLCLAACLLTGAYSVSAQELEPRRWTHLPINVNVTGFGYGYTTADIAFDPVLEIDEATMNLHMIGLGYVRTFGLLGTTARAGFKIPYQDGIWKGTPDRNYHRGRPDRATPARRVFGVKVAWIRSRTQEHVGYDSDTIAIGGTVLW